MHKKPKLNDIIRNVRALGEMLIPYNFPQSLSKMEDDLAIFKEREIIIDGYPIILHYQKADYEKYFLESLQIYGTNSPFLPFNLICKLGKRFLGSKYLSLVEIFKENRKIYIWSVCVNKDGKSIPSPEELVTEECEFEGFNYLYMQPSQIEFF